MDEHQIKERTALICSIIGAVAMCVAATVPIALVAGAKHTPPYRGEDPTLIKSASQTDRDLASVISWVSAGR